MPDDDFADQFEHLVEVYRVTEYRDGAVYRTESLGKRWVTMKYNLGRNPENPEEFFGPISTTDPDARTIPRRKKN